MYHVYAVANANATTFTGICSASASAPTGASYTYFRYLGSFYNNSADNIEPFYWSGNGSTCKISFDDPTNHELLVLNAGTSANFADVTCVQIPTTAYLVSFNFHSADALGQYNFRANGSAATTGIALVNLPTNLTSLITDLPIVNQVLEYKKISGTSLDLNVADYTFNR
jgi:hypothetical protein